MKVVEDPTGLLAPDEILNIITTQLGTTPWSFPRGMQDWKSCRHAFYRAKGITFSGMDDIGAMTKLIPNLGARSCLKLLSTFWDYSTLSCDTSLYSPCLSMSDASEDSQFVCGIETKYFTIYWAKHSSYLSVCDPPLRRCEFYHFGSKKRKNSAVHGSVLRPSMMYSFCKTSHFPLRLFSVKFLE